MHSKSAKAWTELEDRLFRQGALWGPAVASPVTRWALDAYEGPARMRKRIRFKIAHHTAEPLQNKVTCFRGRTQENRILFPFARKRKRDCFVS